MNIIHWGYQAWSWAAYHSRNWRKAFPRWLQADFSSRVSSAKVLPRSGKKNRGSYPKPRLPRGTVSISPSASPEKVCRVAPFLAAAMTQTYFPAIGPGG